MQLTTLPKIKSKKLRNAPSEIKDAVRFLHEIDRHGLTLYRAGEDMYVWALGRSTTNQIGARFGWYFHDQGFIVQAGHSDRKIFFKITPTGKQWMETILTIGDEPRQEKQESSVARGGAHVTPPVAAVKIEVEELDTTPTVSGLLGDMFDILKEDEIMSVLQYGLMQLEDDKIKSLKRASDEYDWVTVSTLSGRLSVINNFKARL